MKSKIILLFAAALFLMTSCTGIKSTTKGLENESYIEIVGTPNNYPDGVKVMIDDNKPFTAEVTRAGSKRPKGVTYAISTGRHKITIKQGNKILYSKEIFVSAQETKQIALP